MTDLTILIPYQYDGPFRLRNLQASVGHWASLGHTPLVGDYSPNRKDLRLQGCDIVIPELIYPYFSLPYAINELVIRCETENFLYIDTDCVIAEDHLNRLIDMFVETGADMVCGSTSPVITINEHETKLMAKGVNFSNISRFGGHYYETCPGGFILGRKNIYMRAGMENEKFGYHGQEDRERVFRFASLGYNMLRGDITVYHMAHPVKVPNGTEEQAKKNNLKFYKESIQKSPSETMDDLLTQPQVIRLGLTPKFESDTRHAGYVKWKKYMETQNDCE